MRRFRAVWIIVVLFLLFTGLPGAIGYYTDWLWFREVGFQSVFATELTTVPPIDSRTRSRSVEAVPISRWSVE